MLSRQDFIFTIGYDGDTAVVDGHNKSRFGKLSTEELARAGLFKQALASALFEEDGKAAEQVLSIYNDGNSHPTVDVEHLKRTYGVTRLSEGITKSKSF